MKSWIVISIAALAACLSVMAWIRTESPALAQTPQAQCKASCRSQYSDDPDVIPVCVAACADPEPDLPSPSQGRLAKAASSSSAQRLGGLAEEEGGDYSGATDDGPGNTGCQMLTVKGSSGRHQENTRLCFNDKVMTCNRDRHGKIDHQYSWIEDGPCPIVGVSIAKDIEYNMEARRKEVDDKKPY